MDFLHDRSIEHGYDGYPLLIDADLIVVGGGLAGLSAAALVAQAGRSVIVLEQSGQLGGRAATQFVMGFIGISARMLSIVAAMRSGCSRSSTSRSPGVFRTLDAGCLVARRQRRIRSPRVSVRSWAHGS